MISQAMTLLPPQPCIPPSGRGGALIPGAAGATGGHVPVQAPEVRRTLRRREDRPRVCPAPFPTNPPPPPVCHPIEGGGVMGLRGEGE